MDITRTPAAATYFSNSLYFTGRPSLPVRLDGGLFAARETNGSSFATVIYNFKILSEKGYLDAEAIFVDRTRN